MGLEPTTATLATWRSTTELHPPESALIVGADAGTGEEDRLKEGFPAQLLADLGQVRANFLTGTVHFVAVGAGPGLLEGEFTASHVPFSLHQFGNGRERFVVLGGRHRE